MDIEQTRPNKPNFLLVVVFAAVAIVVILVMAYFFVDFEGGHIRFKPQNHPTSRLVMPAANSDLPMCS